MEYTHLFSRILLPKPATITYIGQPSFSNPVNNQDLPTLRALNMKWLIDKSALNQNVAVIEGKVFNRVNPEDRCVRIYLIQTSEDLKDNYEIYFK